MWSLQLRVAESDLGSELQGPVVQSVDNAIQRINRDPEDNCQENVLRYTTDTDLSSG